MPLFDHFHGPIDKKHQWVSFPSRWATAIADDLEATYLEACERCRIP